MKPWWAASRWIRSLALLVALLSWSPSAAAQVVPAEPLSPVVAPFPAGVAAIETQVVLQVVVDATGAVESVAYVSRAPPDAPEAFVQAAIDAVKAVRFAPSSRDGRAIRSRIEYVVVFRPPAAAPSPSPSSPLGPAALPPAAPPPEAPRAGPPDAAETTPREIQVRGVGWASPRGLGDIRVDRETLTASPRQQTSEMLSAAPGFFVDHEDGEGLGNDVFLRGFDLDNGSGIEMKIGAIPTNVPMHIHGQGYADVNFIIPEVVRSIRVLEGPYDPRQGDAAIVGSALFDLGVPERGYQLKATYGSFDQARFVGIAAPPEATEETFAAFALRETRGFGQDRASKSASVNAQYGVDLGDADHLRVLATGYASRSDLPGVVREDDVQAGRIGYYDAYPYFNSFYPTNCSSPSCAEAAQGVSAARVILGAELEHTTKAGTRFAVAPWFLWTNFLSRQNYTSDLNGSNLQPDLPSLGDLWELRNVETAGGVTARVHTPPLHVGRGLELVAEPGVSLRVGHTDQSKNLLDPADLAPWDYRAKYALDTVDLAAYLDVDLRLWKRLRVSGGVRADFLDVGVDNKLAGVVAPVPTGALAGTSMNVAGVAPGPRVTVAYEALPELTPVISAGEGFRSLDAVSLTLCNAKAVAQTGTSKPLPPCAPGSPYSQVTSFEAGLRSAIGRGRFTATLTAFETHVQNELVFAVDAGGFETERASTRRGIVGSVLARPAPWLLASTALSVQMATFDTLVAGTSHDVPNVPGVLWRADVNAHGRLVRLSGVPLTGRVGVGYTLLGQRHVNDSIMIGADSVLNALASLRYGPVEI
ncbi:MAG: TonB-dependent receptor, partial [Myxococcales bacterium]|nr:TonB-dependent receptor [Myxococcales bacterium]